jgi:hypothetical protein
MSRILILLLIIIIFYSNFTNNRYERFYTSNMEKQTDPFSSFNDPLLKDVPYFENDLNGMTGWNKCKLSCNGHCLEYGITGASWCFPFNTVLPNRPIITEDEVPAHATTNP